jgi:hypothetical protein
MRVPLAFDDEQAGVASVYQPQGFIGQAMTCNTSAALRRSAALVGLSLMLPCAHAQTPMPPAQSNPAADKSSSDAASYSLGLTFGDQMHSAGLSDRLSIEQFNRGVQEGLAGKVISVDDQQRVTQFLKSARERVGIENAASARQCPRTGDSNYGIRIAIQGGHARPRQCRRA